MTDQDTTNKLKIINKPRTIYITIFAVILSSVLATVANPDSIRTSFKDCNNFENTYITINDILFDQPPTEGVNLTINFTGIDETMVTLSELKL